ncbi:hypothetical protein Tsubulata_040787 [Turnera subulata]|uniref:F-box domain-containing protein n=1 Tax=Turnera subulata TaxID=218843 RepID=A0A9Q0FWD2_9ROSI|nr:hypothetical protein Tsubulata_040787 [Turnera subulata]
MDACWWSLIPYLWQKLLGGVYSKKVEIESLPDDLIINILSRLPADHVLECRRVCKRWRALTSTSSFARLQLKRATPGILAGCMNYRNPRCIYVNSASEGLLQPMRRFLNAALLLDDEGEPIPPHQLAEPNIWLLTSRDGLILGRRKEPDYVVVINPLTQEEITIPEHSNNENKAFTCGLYFHPPTKEYRMLSAFLQGNYYQYIIVNLPTSSSWRALSHRFYCCPASSDAILASGNLHWIVEHNTHILTLKMQKDDHPCANSILRFNIFTENLDTMPHPEHGTCPGPSCGQMRLLEVDGNLSLSHRRGYSVNVWTLADYASWHWRRRYKLDLAHHVFPKCSLKARAHLLWIQDDEAFLHLEQGLFVYNLKLRTLREIKLSQKNRYIFCSHTKSLVSLRKI